jgi:cation diffusion facilitator family transporter
MEQSEVIREKKNIALTSVGAAIFLTSMKLIVGLQTNSLGILSEAAHSGLDLIAAVITYMAVTIADRPPDKNHPYGHGKIENVSALMETILLFLTCAWIIWEAIHRLLAHTSHVEATVWSFSVMAVAILIDISRSRALYRVAKKHNSQALEADALHFSSDVWSSLVVIAGLFFVSTGFPMVDAIAAIGVALLVLFVSYRLGRRTIDALMDRVPTGLEEHIFTAVKGIDGVKEIRNMRLRQSGPKVFVDITIAIRRTLPFENAHTIMDNVEKAIHAAHTAADVVVHAEPMESDDETISDKIRMIVMKKGHRAPHNLHVHQSNGKYYIDFDIEYQKGKTFIEAHGMASEIERDIREGVVDVDKVTIHMEEFHPGETEFKDVTEADAALRENIRAYVLNDKRILKCPGVTLLKIGRKYNIALTCEISKAKKLDEVHQIISQAESQLYQNFPSLRKITIHAEPV